MYNFARLLTLFLVGCVADQVAPAPQTHDAAAEAAQKALDAAPTHSVAKVDQAEAKAAAKLEAPLPKAIAPLLSNVVIPILLPDNAALLETAKFTYRRDWYGAAMQQDDARIYVQGTRKQVAAPHPWDAAKRGQVSVAITEGMPVATFMRFGVAYMVEVSCASPFGDSACTGESYVRELVNSLRVVDVAEEAP